MTGSDLRSEVKGSWEGAGQESILQSGLEISATVLASSFLLRLLSPRVVGRLRVNHLGQVRRARPGIKKARGFGRNGSGTAGVRVHSAARPAKAASGSSARPPAAAREPGEPRDPGRRPGPGAGAAGGGGGGARAPALGAGTTPPSPRVTLGSPWAAVNAGSGSSRALSQCLRNE